MLVRIANREDPDQTASYQGLQCLSTGKSFFAGNKCSKQLNQSMSSNVCYTHKHYVKKQSDLTFNCMLYQ